MAQPYKVVSDYTAGVSTNTNVQVFVRARPPEKDSDEDLKERFGVSAEDPKKISMSNKTAVGGVGEHAFSFDKVFWTETEQTEIFSTVCQTQVDHCLRGYNSCCFAYGQTSSGKTYTMFGEGNGDTRGMIPRANEYLFSALQRSGSIKAVKVEISFMEIYCDKIRDLGRAYMIGEVVSGSRSRRSSKDGSEAGSKTSDVYLAQEMKRSESFSRGLTRIDSKGQVVPLGSSEFTEMDLQIHEDAQGEVYVKDLTLVPVNSAEEINTVIAEGLKLRATHETKMNAVSSRSHTVFTIVVTQTDRTTGEGFSGRINLVDLAGSERLKKSESEGMRLKEALHINSSLTALGKVVMALDPNAASSHVPYRDCKLTRVLQNSLGGNSYTTLIAAIHPCEDYSEECLSTLQFANRCRVVQNQPRVTYVGEESMEAKDKRIKELNEENKQLKRKLGAAGISTGEDGVDLEISLDMMGMMGMGSSKGKPGETREMAQRRAKQLQAIAKQTNEMILQVLEGLGIEASQGPDGRILLADGRVVGQRPPSPVGSLAEGDDEDKSVMSKSVATMDGGGEGGGGGGGGEGGGAASKASGASGMSREVRRKLRSVEKERDSLRKKLIDMKSAQDRNARQGEAEKRAETQAARLELEAQKKAGAALASQLEQSKAAAASMSAQVSQLHDSQVADLMGRSRQMLAEQQALHDMRASVQRTLMQGAGGGGGDGSPRSLGDNGSGGGGGGANDFVHAGEVKYLTGGGGAGGGKSRAHMLNESQLRATLKAHEFSKRAELENIKQQYEFWLKKRNDEAVQFVNDFNSYRSKTKERLKGAETELLRVYRHARSLSRIVGKLQRGEYPMRQTGRIAVPCIHGDDLPTERHLLSHSMLRPETAGAVPQGTGSKSNIKPASARGGLLNAAPNSSRLSQDPDPTNYGQLVGIEMPDHLPVVRAVLKRRMSERKRHEVMVDEARSAGIDLTDMSTRAGVGAAPYPDENNTFASDGRTLPRAEVRRGNGVASPSGLPATGPSVNPGARRSKSRQQQDQQQQQHQQQQPQQLHIQSGGGDWGRSNSSSFGDNNNNNHNNHPGSPQPPLVPRQPGRGSGLAAAASASRRPASAPRMRSSGSNGRVGGGRQQRLSQSATNRQGGGGGGGGRRRTGERTLEDDDSSDEEAMEGRGAMPLATGGSGSGGGGGGGGGDEHAGGGGGANHAGNVVATSAVAGARGEDLDLDVDAFVERFDDEACASLGAEELGEAMRTVREYLTRALPVKVEQMVMAELQGADTVTYLAQLEGTLATKDGTIAEQARQLNALRVAHEAQTRRFAATAQRRTEKPQYGSVSRGRVRAIDGASVPRGDEALSRPSPHGFRQGHR